MQTIAFFTIQTIAIFFLFIHDCLFLININSAFAVSYNFLCLLFAVSNSRDLKDRALAQTKQLHDELF